MSQRIWVIDDDEADQHLTLTALKRVRPDASTRGFMSLRSALEALEEGPAPDVVFVDWTLPGEDTSTAPHLLGVHGAWTCLLTNLDCALIPERVSFDCYASKPFGFDALCRLLDNSLRRCSESS